MLLKTNNISKRFSWKSILKDISLSVNKGEVLGLLGSNGAGKSTTMQIIAGCLIPDSGDVQLAGISLLDDPVAYKSKLGYLSEHPPLYKDMTVADYLTFSAKIRGISTANVDEHLEYALDSCDLTTVHKQKIGKLSKGFQQRVGIAQCIIHYPELIILDEPTVGLDPQQQDIMRNLIATLSKDSGIIMSTHIMQEVEACCDSFLMLKGGSVVLGDDVENIKDLSKAFVELAC